jgi:hypothetical protein
VSLLAYKTESEKLQKFVVVVKYLQFVFIAILLYGTAMLSFDIVQIIPNVQISAWSIGITVFGGEGAIVSYFIIRSTEKKISRIINVGKN